MSRVVLLLALLWGGSYPLIKLAVDTIPPLTVTAARAGLGGLLLQHALTQAASAASTDRSATARSSRSSSSTSAATAAPTPTTCSASRAATRWCG